METPINTSSTNRTRLILAGIGIAIICSLTLLKDDRSAQSVDAVKSRLAISSKLTAAGMVQRMIPATSIWSLN